MDFGIHRRSCTNRFQDSWNFQSMKRYFGRTLPSWCSIRSKWIYKISNFHSKPISTYPRCFFFDTVATRSSRIKSSRLFISWIEGEWIQTIRPVAEWSLLSVEERTSLANATDKSSWIVWQRQRVKEEILRNWVCEFAKTRKTIANKFSSRDELHRINNMAAPLNRRHLLILCLIWRRRRRSKYLKRFWGRPMFIRRKQFGEFFKLFTEMRREDH